MTRAQRFFRPPFRFEGGYIWDADGEMVADNRADGDDASALVLRQRGWGRISYESDPESLYQEIGREVAAALTRGWEATVKP